MNSVQTMQVMDLDSKSGFLTSTPNWGSYLYQNFLLSGFSPSDWVNSTPSGQTGVSDYFGVNQPGATNGWSADFIKTEPIDQPIDQPQLQPPQPPQPQPPQQPQTHASFYPQPFHPSMSISPSLLVSQTSSPGLGTTSDMIEPSLHYHHPSSASASASTSMLPASPTHSTTTRSDHSAFDIRQLVRSPSPISTVIHTPHTSPGQLHKPQLRFSTHGRPLKRRASSLDSDIHSDHANGTDGGTEHETEVAEGVERDGMIWGMKVEDYRALSARERKRVRNRISARTFRAKRKEHLSSLETDLYSKDVQIKAAKDEASHLRRQVEMLKKRLAAYEPV